MKEYRAEQEVYYLHKETGYYISKTELLHYMKEEERNSIAFGKTEPFRLQGECNIKRFAYRIKDIPFSDDWETIVMYPHTLNKRDIYAILDGLDSSVIQGDLQLNAKIKLVEELKKLDERRYRFNVEIPTY